jgi:hypothetical protein
MSNTKTLQSAIEFFEAKVKANADKDSTKPLRALRDIKNVLRGSKRFYSFTPLHVKQ